jgi:CheY-like chemotaxis protein
MRNRYYLITPRQSCLKFSVRGVFPPHFMHSNGKKQILAVVEDLFFTVKIADSAKRSGLDVVFVKTEHEALERMKDHPVLVIVDLNAASLHPIKLIEKIKANEETKNISILGYVSHVQGELKQKAHDIGCDMVLAKSAFSVNLPMILKRHSGVRL